MTNTKQEAEELCNKWKVGMLAAYSFHNRELVVCINDIFNKNTRFPLCIATVMDPGFDDISIPLYKLRAYDSK